MAGGSREAAGRIVRACMGAPRGCAHAQKKGRGNGQELHKIRYTHVIDVGTRGGAHEEGAHTRERHATPRPN